MTNNAILTPATATAEQDGRHDFDFYHGRWNVASHRLLKRLQNCDTWEDFEATSVCWPTLGGIGNMDEFRTDFWNDFIAMTIRFFNPQTKLWSLYWVTNRNGVLEPPVIGSFKDGTGIFEGPDVFEGKPILVRFTWSDITPTSARWQQAFSTDHGATWEVNWVMTHTRVEASPYQ